MFPNFKTELNLHGDVAYHINSCNLCTSPGITSVIVFSTGLKYTAGIKHSILIVGISYLSWHTVSDMGSRIGIDAYLKKNESTN